MKKSDGVVAKNLLEIACRKLLSDVEHKVKSSRSIEGTNRQEYVKALQHISHLKKLLIKIMSDIDRDQEQ